MIFFIIYHIELKKNFSVKAFSNFEKTPQSANILWFCHLSCLLYQVPVTGDINQLTERQ